MNTGKVFFNSPSRFVPFTGIVESVSIALIALFVIPASATQNTEDLDDSIEEVVITATRIETTSSKVGSSVTVITAEEMERKQYRFVLDALREVPGLDIRQSGGTGSQTSIFMRGTNSDHTLVLIDGVRVHDPSNPNGAAAIDNLSVENIERIEVVRGPQSMLYGSDAIGGVINIITKRGEGPMQTTVSLEGGSFQTFTERLSTRGGGERLDYSLTISRTDTDGVTARPTNREHDGYANTTVNARLGIRATDRLNIDIYSQYINARVEADFGSDPLLSESDTEQILFKIAPRLESFDGRWTQTFGAWVHDIQRDTDGTGFGLPAERHGTLYGLDWQNDIEVSARSTFTFGADGEWQQVDNEVAGSPDFDRSTKNFGFYAQDAIEVGEAFNTTLGVRVDEHDQFGSHVTYRGTAAYRVARTDTTFRGSVGTGFKAPTLVELFDSSFGSNNPALEPEESLGFDIGVEQEFVEQHLTVGATFFYNEIDELIVAVFDGMGFVNENVEKALTQGVESFVTLEPTDALSFRVRYTYTHTEAKEAASFGLSKGSRLLRRPYHNASMDLSYRFLEERAQATLSIQYVGERRDLDPMTFATVTAEDYEVVNLTASYSPRENLTFTARLNNLFDEDYEEVLGFNTPGFGATAGVSVTF